MLQKVKLSLVQNANTTEAWWCNFGDHFVIHFRDYDHIQATRTLISELMSKFIVEIAYPSFHKIQTLPNVWVF